MSKITDQNPDLGTGIVRAGKKNKRVEKLPKAKITTLKPPKNSLNNFD